MGMNIQKSAGVKADTFILKRNNMDRRIRMDVAMLIILAICTRLVAIPEVKGVPEAKDGKAAWANMDSAKTETITQETETITQETVTDKSVPESITGKITEEPAGEPMTDDLLNLEGFKVNSEGVIEGYENLDLILCDGMIIFPADERCSGIGEHALDGIPDAVEVYIPANITFVAPGVLEKIGGLMYIEVAPDNPVYESRDGMLYNKEGELISRPNGR